uniref:THAP-type domain-containing protein n=1 Tax=Ixodes ricinus TaxID=34613 RepID=A0A6B0UU16_IXORI
MPWCCVPLCKASSKKGNRLFPFPRDEVRRKIWETQVQRDRWKVTNGSRICERHFEEDQFEQNRQDGRRLLKSSAVPTLFAFRRSDLDGTTQSAGHGDGATLLGETGFLEKATEDICFRCCECTQVRNLTSAPYAPKHLLRVAV